ncbi:MAG: beta-N-acetylhexosaminidase [Terracidiphilus sp.]|jgi:beta-N-acetylhexosaminidase
MTISLRKAAGSLLVVGLGTTELAALERAWLKLIRPAGIILFKRNIVDPRQTRSLLAESTALCTAGSIRCVDLEGGTVDRLRDALAPMPSAQAVARAAQTKGKPVLAFEHGELVARAVKAFGFNTSLAPVLDLALPASAAILGTRTASESASGVVEYARSFLSGLASQGVIGCGKHYPGLGGGSLDSHHDTPSINRSYQDLWHEDLLPYRELHAELPMVMVAHAAYPDTPGRNVPASASSFWITTVLRKRIGYRGIIFSDDLEMGGILKCMSIEEATIAAIRAGTDLLEICHSPELTLRAFESLISEAERSTAFRKLLLLCAAKTARKRTHLFAAAASKPLADSQFEALRTRIRRFSEKVKNSQPAPEAQSA